MDSREKLTTNKLQTQQAQRIPVSVVQDASNRKRIQVVSKEGEAHLPVAAVSNKVITTAPPNHSSSTLPPQRNRLTGFRVPSVNLAEMQNQTSTAIKNAFQNIFKLPFRTNQVTTNSGVTASPVVDDYKWLDEPEEGGGDGVDGDIDTLENTAGELELDQSAASEKHLFAHKTHNLMHTIGTVATAQQSTQKQALREGGIIIQRLKVRKGGIAIAGPGAWPQPAAGAQQLWVPVVTP